MHFAIRETTRHLSEARVLAAMAIVAGVLGFSGPFGTFDALPTGPRLAYWAAVVVVTYVAGFAVGAFAGRILPVGSRPLRAVLTGLVIGPPVTAFVVLINWLSFGSPRELDWLALLAYCTGIAVAVTAISELVETVKTAQSDRLDDPSPESSGPARPAQETAPILDRIPVHLRSDLICISVSDHYVEVVTRKGTSLVLMRFADAMREIGTTRGLQVHRSHWVALDAIASVRRHSGRTTILLEGGRSLPVSRTFVPEIRRAGLLV